MIPTPRRRGSNPLGESVCERVQESQNPSHHAANGETRRAGEVSGGKPLPTFSHDTTFTEEHSLTLSPPKPSHPQGDAPTATSQQGLWDRWTDHRPDDLKAARKKAKAVVTPTRMPDGPCCGRCRNWDAPAEKGEAFGTCVAIDCVIRRYPRGPEVGTLIARDVPLFRRMRREEVGVLPDGQPIRVKAIAAELRSMRVRDWAPACSRFVGADMVMTGDEAA